VVRGHGRTVPRVLNLHAREQRLGKLIPVDERAARRRLNDGADEGQKNDGQVVRQWPGRAPVRDGVEKERGLLTGGQRGVVIVARVEGPQLRPGSGELHCGFLCLGGVVVSFLEKLRVRDELLERVDAERDGNANDARDHSHNESLDVRHFRVSFWVGLLARTLKARLPHNPNKGVRYFFALLFRVSFSRYGQFLGETQNR